MSTGCSGSAVVFAINILPLQIKERLAIFVVMSAQ